MGGDTSWFGLAVVFFKKCSVVDPDPGSGAFLTPGSGTRNRFSPDLGSRIPNLYFCELSDNFLGNYLKIGPNFFSLAFQK